MKQSLCRWLTALTIVVFTCTAGPAFAEHKPVSSTKPAKPKLFEFSGEITAVDAKTSSLSVKDKETDTTKQFSCDAKVKIHGKNGPVKLEALKVGDKVTVKYKDENGALTAEVIGPQTATSSTASKTTATKTTR